MQFILWKLFIFNKSCIAVHYLRCEWWDMIIGLDNSFAQYINKWSPSSVMHICTTRGRRVKPFLDFNDTLSYIAERITSTMFCLYKLTHALPAMHRKQHPLLITEELFVKQLKWIIAHSWWDFTPLPLDYMPQFLLFNPPLIKALIFSYEAL